MKIAASERQEFVHFMQQYYWMKHYRKDVIIYSIETDWLRPYDPVFYVGATEDLKKREKEHRRVWRNQLKRATPTDLYVDLSSVESLMEQALTACTAMRKNILAAASYQGYTIIFTQLDTIFLQEYLQDEQLLSPFEKKAIQLGNDKTRFSIECLERERRWVFKKLQEQCTLTNGERMYTQMTGELQARPELDVVSTPFSSSLWNPIFQAYLRDIERMGLLPHIP